jgi:hypothetical protein
VSADQYLQELLQREFVDTGPQSQARGMQALLEPMLRQWAGGAIEQIKPSGSFAKGTAIRSGTDIDLFISLSSATSDTLQQIYEKLFAHVKLNGYTPKQQNVSIGLRVSTYDVDLVPAKRQSYLGQDHSLWRRRAKTWTKTNVDTHIRVVSTSGCTNEIKVLKMWRNQKLLDFPSFYLELSAIRAITDNPGGSLSNNVWNALEYLRDKFANARIIDPANTNNVISDDLNAVEKQRIASAAATARAAKNWSEIVQ